MYEPSVTSRWLLALCHLPAGDHTWYSHQYRYSLSLSAAATIKCITHANKTGRSPLNSTIKGVLLMLHRNTGISFHRIRKLLNHYLINVQETAFQYHALCCVRVCTCKHIAASSANVLLTPPVYVLPPNGISRNWTKCITLTTETTQPFTQQMRANFLLRINWIAVTLFLFCYTYSQTQKQTECKYTRKQRNQNDSPFSWRARLEMANEWWM